MRITLSGSCKVDKGITSNKINPHVYDMGIVFLILDFYFFTHDVLHRFKIHYVQFDGKPIYFVFFFNMYRVILLSFKTHYFENCSNFFVCL